MTAVPVPPVQLDPLIAEAKQRQRRRRLVLLATVLAAGAAGYGIDRAVGSGQPARPLPAVDASAFAGHGRLAFVSRGRLYVLDGRARRLVAVTGTGASAPAFSPDGRWLTYLYRGRVGLAAADGTGARTLSTRLGASWLPDGRLLAGRAIYRIAPDGTPLRAGSVPVDPVAWAPDGSRFVFDTTRIVHDRGGAFHGVELIQVAHSLAGRRVTWYRIPQRFTPRSGFRTPGVVRVVVLPRRQGILFWLDPGHSESLAADGLPVYRLAAPGAKPRKLGTTVGFGVSIARTGSFALAGGVDRIAWVTKTALACRAARCAPVRSTAPLTLEPALSPDGSTLAYVTAASEGTNLSFVQPALRRWYATRRLRIGTRLVPESAGAAAPVWSADGRSLLFAKDDALWLLPSLHGRPVRVAAPLFGTRAWPNAHGNVPWPSQFAWSSRP
ncbi:MAG TPA: hypothetical protein VFJ91_07855 [Gaiellaceae bacterium]|nr:hypothetical protein [Gaiellaceae bacterium]